MQIAASLYASITGLTSYQTTERIVGKWLNGETIYRIDGTFKRTSNLPMNEDLVIGTMPSGYTKAVKMDLCMNFGSDENISNTFCVMYIEYGTRNILVRQTYGSTNSGMRFNYSIWYLKQ